jgi:DNA invertase Pin-like site-specific DNA recombinase
MPDEKITATEARQATMRPRGMVLVPRAHRRSSSNTRVDNDQSQSSASGTSFCCKRAPRQREQLEAALEYAREGDSLVVTKLDRLARSVSHLVPSVSG